MFYMQEKRSKGPIVSPALDLPCVVDLSDLKLPKLRRISQSRLPHRDSQIASI